MIVIGISGGSGSGKTTLAKHLKSELCDRSAIVGQDSYYRDLSHMKVYERSDINFDHPDSLDWRLLRKHLKLLKSKKSVNIPNYDFNTHTRKGSVLIKPFPVTILEGHLIYSNDKIRDLIDIKVFIKSEIDILLCRRILRDTSERGRSIESIIDQYMKTVRPMYFRFVAPCAKYANIILPKNGSIEEFAKIILSHL